MRTSDAVTQASGLPIAYGFLALVYLGLIAVVVWLLRRLARRPAEAEASSPPRVAAAAR
jgi:cytochrome d ubiquinol oxidase subunit I